MGIFFIWYVSYKEQDVNVDIAGLQKPVIMKIKHRRRDKSIDTQE